MRKQDPTPKPKKVTRYAKQQNLPSMATPRRAEEPKKVNFFGVLFMVGILGGVAWLAMVIFGIGPYAEDLPGTTTNDTEMIISELEPSSTWTLAPTAIPTNTLSPTLPPQTTSTVTSTPELLPFTLYGEPEPMSSAMIPQQKLDCGWLVIAGQVWDLQGGPVVGMTLHLFGELDGTAIDLTALSGSALAYGESGYQFALEGLVIDSIDSLFIQLVDSNSLLFSHPYALQTYNDCEKNLILVNFKQVR